MMQRHIEDLPEIHTVALFPELNKQLLMLLKNLTQDDWKKPTVLPGRTVKDLASHLLDGSLRRLSSCRDDYQSEIPKIESYKSLVAYIQKLNSSWIEATKRLSPQILITLLEHSEQSLYEYFKALNPQANAPFPVAWAGQTESPNWFDIAREYTEKWHHQMQIRLAVNMPGMQEKSFFYPVIDTFIRGLPYAYRNTKTAPNSGIKIHIAGEGGGFWFLEHTADQWHLVKHLKQEPETTIEISDNLAWQVWTDSISKDEAAKSTHIIGNRALGEPLLTMRTTLR